MFQRASSLPFVFRVAVCVCGTNVFIKCLPKCASTNSLLGLFPKGQAQRRPCHKHMNGFLAALVVPFRTSVSALLFNM